MVFYSCGERNGRTLWSCQKRSASVVRSDRNAFMEREKSELFLETN